MAEFNLGDLIAKGKVPDLGTKGRKQIEYIDIDLIESDPENFYEISGIDDLAANIELCGLQQPLLVRDHPSESGRVMIVSGHRRRTAIAKLVAEGRTDLRMVPCIRDQDGGSDALRKLRLIYANSDTRRMSSSDISKQVQEVERLLYQLKEEGYEFPGRMRDHVAEACKVSKSKLARLKVIRDRLEPCWVPAYEKSELGESTAHALAQLPAEHQQVIYEHWMEPGKSPRQLYETTVQTYGKRLESIDKLTCKFGGSCSNISGKRRKALNADYWSYVHCDKCCASCQDLGKCKNACPRLADKAKAMRDAAKEQRAQEKAELEAKEKPQIQAIQALWHRFGEARSRVGVEIDAVYKAIGRYSHQSDIQNAYKLEAGEGKVSTSTYLPYGYCCSLSDVQKYIKAADALNCSIDYLFCRTDDPKGLDALAAPAGVAWYPSSKVPEIGQEIVVVDYLGMADSNVYEGASTLRHPGVDWKDVIMWTPMPSDPASLPATEPPTEGCVPLRWIPGTELPKKDGQKAAARFAVPGMENPLERIVKWDEFDRVWKFHNGSGSIECECLAWFPLPEEDA